MRNSSAKNLCLTGREAEALSIAMLTARAFLTLRFDGARYGNAGWLCALLGFLPALPVALCAERTRLTGGLRALPALAVFGACGVFEAAVLARILLQSADFCNLEALSPNVTLALTLLGCWYVIRFGGRGIGNAARLWGYLFAALYLASLLAKFRLLRPGYLAPILGSGWKGLLTGSLVVAGNYVASLTPLFFARRDDLHRPRAVRALALGCSLCAALCLINAMLSPAVVNGSAQRMFRLDLMLDNGRTALGLQLPMVFLWFLGILFALCGFGMTGAFCLNRALPRFSPRLCCALALLGVAVVASSGLAESGGAARFGTWEYALLLLAGIWSLCSARKEGADEKTS